MGSAIIVAAGSGERFGGSLPKQFIELGGLPMLAWSVMAAAASGAVTEIIVGSAANRLAMAEKVLGGLALSMPVKVCSGGATRQESVRNCLRAVDKDSALVIIHDAARPFARPALFKTVLLSAAEHGAATVAVRPADTIKRVEGNKSENLARETLWMVQTPQAFRLDLIRRAHAQAAEQGIQVTDDTALAELAGVTPAIVIGDRSNIKITQKDDLAVAEALLAARLVRPEDQSA